MIALFALAIFLTFAIVGGSVVWFIVKNQPEDREDGLPPRGVPWDSPCLLYTSDAADE